MRQDLELLIPYNKEVFLFFNLKRFALFDKLYKLLIYLGKGQTTLLYGPLLIYSSSKEGILPETLVGVHLFVSLSLIALICNILKSVFRQHRPSSILKETIVIEGVYHRSFPSSDTAFIISITTLFWLHAHTLFFPLFLFFSVIVAYGRMYLGSHFPFDIIIGAIIGWLCTEYSIGLSSYLHIYLGL
jgi:undecaprenyl-diphosphatase